jgi:hypothetical protein
VVYDWSKKPGKSTKMGSQRAGKTPKMGQIQGVEFLVVNAEKGVPKTQNASGRFWR